ncbi:hypothetical protein HL658_33600 [Azospirillum sp. RWY-5-1]|uniref:Sulfotransferase domain-containing protein n=1 Tax=Azospirillum oleiclasticum TaxID=2735135 RepID=A0ABX2TLI2_9PROT|nr:hypothetical protein [Azospirillum oleiclasticum]NYZ17504.1 hypothetical protein [Azospirillum oleiclasticum]NYZ24882.1 hypothetical protein [Azospirillum oleiclasticum]
MTDGAAAVDKTYFLLESCGRTATNWISEALNRHPEVLTTHGIDTTPVKVDRTLNPDFKGTPGVALRSESDLPLDEYFDLLEEQRPEPVIGSIHGYNGAIPYLRPENYRRRYRIATITRHPVIRAMSIHNQNMKSFDPRVNPDVRKLLIERNRGFVKANLAAHPEYSGILNAAGFDLENPHDMTFVLSVLVIRNRDSVNLHTGMPVYLMERLTNEIDNFYHLFNFITDGRIPPDQTFIESVLNQPKRFTSATERAGFLQYKSWSDWQRRFFALAMQYKGLGEAYDKLGYDMSYVK